MEIVSTDALAERLETGRPLGGVRLQDLDLEPVEPALLRRDDLAGLVVLGGQVSTRLRDHLQHHGAVVFPDGHDAPVDVFRAHLYTGAELYLGLDGPGGYASTVDFRAWEWGRDKRLAHDAYATVLKAIHDDSISDALDEWVQGRRVVGIMGGHAAERGSASYTIAARTGRGLAEAGLLVATGGGPGAMEAANLGAAAPSEAALADALARLAAVPSFRPDVGAWARTAIDVVQAFGPRVHPHPGRPGPAHPRLGSSVRPRSLGVPTWYYGHEPPNVFAEGIAKYFSNAVREDGLLARCTAGVIVLAGAAGTVQEVFQQTTRLYYATPDAEPPPLVLVGRRHWTETVPVWPLLQALGSDGSGARSMSRVVHLVDEPDEAIAVVSGVGGRA